MVHAENYLKHSMTDRYAVWRSSTSIHRQQGETSSAVDRRGRATGEWNGCLGACYLSGHQPTIGCVFIKQ